MNLEIKHYSIQTKEVIGDLVKAEVEIFEHPMSEKDFCEELAGRKNVLITIAYDSGIPCGYKVGYEYSRVIFFSLSGGVIKSHRRKGIATQLMEAQHEKLKEKGFSYVRTHTKNKYREMLLLNIKNGFDVTGVYKSLKERYHGIILEKEL